METIERISILMTAYKNADLVKRSLSSLAAAFGDRLPETVVVDDAAGDKATRNVAEEFARYGVKYAVMPKNGGFAGANNFGYPLCTKEFVVLVNTDIIFHEEPFTAMVEFMDSHPAAGIVQGTLIIKNGEPGIDGTLNGCGAFLTYLGNNTTPGWLAPVDDPVAREARKCFAAYGAMFMMRRDAVKATGRDVPFYDFFHTYYEEVNFCHRVWLSGWEVWYVPTPVVEHAHGATMRKFYAKEDILKKFYRNIWFSYLTCFGAWGRWTIVPMFWLACHVQSWARLLRGHGMDFRAHRWARGELKKLCPVIESERRRIQASRKMPDRKLFRTILRRRTFREMWSVIMGNI